MSAPGFIKRSILFIKKLRLFIFFDVLFIYIINKAVSLTIYYNINKGVLMKKETTLTELLK